MILGVLLGLAALAVISTLLNNDENTAYAPAKDKGDFKVTLDLQPDYGVESDRERHSAQTETTKRL